MYSRSYDKSTVKTSIQVKNLQKIQDTSIQQSTPQSERLEKVGGVITTLDPLTQKEHLLTVIPKKKELVAINNKTGSQVITIESESITNGRETP